MTPAAARTPRACVRSFASTVAAVSTDKVMTVIRESAGTPRSVCRSDRAAGTASSTAAVRLRAPAGVDAVEVMSMIGPLVVVSAMASYVASGWASSSRSRSASASSERVSTSRAWPRPPR